MLSEQLVGLSQEILWLSGPRLSPASEPGQRKVRVRAQGGCIEIASAARVGRAALAGLLEEMSVPIIHRQFCSSQVKQQRLARITHLAEVKRGHPDLQADVLCCPSLIHA